MRSEQALFWIDQVKSRKRKPVAIATLQSWEGCLRKWVNPAIGDLPLSEVNNAALKGLVATMAGKLSPKSIDNYAFRRFRNTYLRNDTQCPEGLRNFWMGHSDESMDALYDKIQEDVKFRREMAEKCGLGFELPSVVPNVPNVPRQGIKAPIRKAA